MRGLDTHYEHLKSNPHVIGNDVLIEFVKELKVDVERWLKKNHPEFLMNR